MIKRHSVQTSDKRSHRNIASSFNLLLLSSVSLMATACDSAPLVVNKLISEGEVETVRYATRGEVQMLKTVYGESKHISKTPIIKSRGVFKTVLGTAQAYAVEYTPNLTKSVATVFAKSVYCKDFSASSCSYGYLFLHEWAHVEQYDDPFTYNIRGDVGGGEYQYDLKETSVLFDFEADQQAEIIEDFSKSFIFGNDHCDAPLGKEKKLLRDFVFANFPQTKTSCENNAWAAYKKPKIRLSYKYP